jgi:AraC family transcriptional regulator of adaptative response / DNA-3-methyladenine glycosylase II
MGYQGAMQWSHKECYEAALARDARFDGEFFICVKSTGIYCRPVCPALMPKLENCSFVPTAAAAEDSGYRPCLRCRPETAPGSPAWMGTGTTVARALRLISEGAGDISITALADRVGVGDRHLRRLFKEQVGAGPKRVAQTERFQLARQLLVETDLSMTEVAHAAGFNSIRRFNDAIRRAFDRSPGEYRRKARARLMGTKKGSRMRAADVSPDLKILLGYRAPFDWDQLLAFFAHRAIPGVEQIADGVYRRSIRLGEAQGILTLQPRPESTQVEVGLQLDGPAHLTSAVRRIRDMLDLDAGPLEIGRHLSRDPMLKPVLGKSPGLRLPGCWDVFELTVRAVIGQQISVKGACTMLGRLAEAYGETLASGDDDITRHFPTPAALAGQDLTRIGLTKARAATLGALAEAFADDADFIHPAMPNGSAVRRLLAIRGIGPWTAGYVAMRGLRQPDAFPPADLGLLKASGFKNARQLEAHAERWRPWRAYAAIALWQKLANQEAEKKK